nr:phosphoribosyltransferase family protein [Actinocrinis puniceicyclus]
MTFHNRAQAARRLAEHVRRLRPLDPVVVALAPRGVPLAVDVAAALAAPLDAVLIHELAVPGCPPGVLGAVGEDGVMVLNRLLATRLGVDAKLLDKTAQQAAAHTEDLRRALREQLPQQPLKGRTAVLVDAGVATGAGASVAVSVLRKRGADTLVLAVPVGASSGLRRLRSQVDALVCVREMPWPRPVHEWYDDDNPDLSDHEVRHVLVSAAREPGSGVPAMAGSGAGAGQSAQTRRGGKGMKPLVRAAYSA